MICVEWGASLECGGSAPLWPAANKKMSEVDSANTPNRQDRQAKEVPSHRTPRRSLYTRLATQLMRQTTRRSFRAEREFGLIVGAVFALLGTWWTYRGKFPAAAHVFLPLGVVLMFSGLTIPRVLVLPNRAWMTMAEGMSYVSTRVILAIVFFLVVTPIGLIKRSMGWDPLHRRSDSEESYWRPYSKRQQDPRHYEKMF